MSGIRTIRDLKDRCRVIEETGCWEWGMGKSGNGQACVWIPALKKRASLGILICVLKTKKAPEPGVVWHCTCTTEDCANPAHRVKGTRSSQMLAAGLRHNAITKAKIAASKRANSKITDAQAAEIRASIETAAVLAERYGISTSHASYIRLGARRRPLAARTSSVFALGSV